MFHNMYTQCYSDAECLYSVTQIHIKVYSLFDYPSSTCRYVVICLRNKAGHLIILCIQRVYCDVWGLSSV